MSCVYFIERASTAEACFPVRNGSVLFQPVVVHLHPLAPVSSCHSLPQESKLPPPGLRVQPCRACQSRHGGVGRTSLRQGRGLSGTGIDAANAGEDLLRADPVCRLLLPRRFLVGFPPSFGSWGEGVVPRVVWCFLFQVRLQGSTSPDQNGII